MFRPSSEKLPVSCLFVCCCLLRCTIGFELELLQKKPREFCFLLTYLANFVSAIYKVPLHSCASKSTNGICYTNLLAGKLQARVSRIALAITDLCKMVNEDTSK